MLDQTVLSVPLSRSGTWKWHIRGVMSYGGAAEELRSNYSAMVLQFAMFPHAPRGGVVFPRNKHTIVYPFLGGNYSAER